MKDMDDLHFPRSVDTVNVDHASLHDEEASRTDHPRGRDIRVSRRFLTAENELIFRISAAGSPAKIREHCNEFATTR